jgi:hypothetical protein
VALLEVGFDKADVFRRDNENHADAHVERLKELVCVDFAELGEILEDCSDGPGSEVDLHFQAIGENARKIAGDAAAGDITGEVGPRGRIWALRELYKRI